MTAFEEADGLQRLADQFDYTHDDIAKKIGRSRSSVTETMSLRVIPDEVRHTCVENGITSKSLLLQVARQPTEKKMQEIVHRIVQGNLTRDEARKARKEEMESAPRPQPFVFDFESEDGAFPHPHAIPQEPRQQRRARRGPAHSPASPGIRLAFVISSVAPIPGGTDNPVCAPAAIRRHK